LTRSSIYYVVTWTSFRCWYI